MVPVIDVHGKTLAIVAGAFGGISGLLAAGVIVSLFILRRHHRAYQRVDQYVRENHGISMETFPLRGSSAASVADPPQAPAPSAGSSTTSVPLEEGA